MTYKILLFMKRRPDISVDAFRDYYENHHAPLCERYISGISRYIRRYVTPLPHPETGPADELPFDVITELWFDEERVFRATLDHVTTTTMPAEIVEDEANLFDRASFRVASVIEHESDLTAEGRGHQTPAMSSAARYEKTMADPIGPPAPG